MHICTNIIFWTQNFCVCSTCTFFLCTNMIVNAKINIIYPRFFVKENPVSKRVSGKYAFLNAKKMQKMKLETWKKWYEKCSYRRKKKMSILIFLRLKGVRNVGGPAPTFYFQFGKKSATKKSQQRDHLFSGHTGRLFSGQSHAFGSLFFGHPVHCHPC